MMRGYLLFGVFGLVKEKPGGVDAFRFIDTVARDVEAAMGAQRVPELLGG
jgi:hypothetical protein